MKRTFLGVLLFFGVILVATSCVKQQDEIQREDQPVERVYVRIASVDQNGTTIYSSVTAVR